MQEESILGGLMLIFCNSANETSLSSGNIARYRPSGNVLQYTLRST